MKEHPIKFRQLITMADGSKFWHYWGFIEEHFTSAQNRHDRSFQFICRLDKNGKEIFEGDILRLTCGGVDAHAVIATVDWDEDRFRAQILDKNILVRGGGSDGKVVNMREMHLWCGSHTCLREWSEHLEVIGNILENPTLL